MHAGALRALEFPRIVEALRAFALTPLGQARLAELRPQSDPARVQAALDATGEGVAYLGEHGAFPLRASSDLETSLAALAIEGRALEPLSLLGVGEFLASIEATRQAVRRVATTSYPILRELADGARSFQHEIAEIRRSVDASGAVVDEATPELRTLRERLRKQRHRLRTTLESYLRSKDTSKYLQEQIVTDRSGRYVLVVKSEHRGAIPGIVHGSSTSGASLFLEPLSTVEINNDIVALEQQEQQEVHRILLDLTDQLRARALDVQRTLAVATELDVIQARAHLAQEMDAVAPALAADARIELRAARHPLLIPSVANRLAGREGPGGPARTQGPVPVDILLTPAGTALVMTGPNTGGKTVALKTAGLLALMAQAGLHIPAAPGSRLPVFRSVFADIGDEQSIAASLSTFSWHITNIVSMDRALSLPALVLLDEIGAGTDPAEGGALGMAIIEHFRQRGALLIATTHDDALKSYASTTEGVVGAGFGFDPETYAPTYRLNYGSPGRSLALEIAQRLGMPASVVSAARQLRSAREAQLADHLAKMEQELHALEHERRLASRERTQIADVELRIRQREDALRHKEETFKRRLDEQLDERLRDARGEIEAIIEDLRRQAAALTADAARRSSINQSVLSTGETGAARATARAAVEAVVERVRVGTLASESGPPAAAEPSRSTEAAAIGDRVVVSRLGMEGTVQALHDRDAEVDVRGKRLRVALDDLRLIERSGSTSRARVSVNVQLQPREGMLSELNVIGCSVDEALTRTEKFLDEALMSEQRTLRVIHGHGTGQLRRAIAGLLHQHPIVARFTSAPPEQGGGGVTVVELKD